MKHGINVTKETLTTLAQIVAVVDDSLEDGKLKVAEGVKIVLKATSLIKLVKQLKELKAELKDLDLAEKAELVAHFEQEFDMRNDKAEIIVESLVRLAVEIVNNIDIIKGRNLPEGSELAEKVVTKNVQNDIQIR